MTQEEKIANFREQCKIVATYIKYLKGTVDEFPYSRREFKKALQAVLFAANKQQKYREYIYYKSLEEKKIEDEHIKSDDNFESRHLIPPFK